MLKRRVFNRSASLLLLMLACIPLALLIGQTFRLTTSPSLPFWLAAICLCQWFATTGKNRFVFSLLLSLALLFLIFHLYSADLPAELSDMARRIGGVYYNYLLGKEFVPEETALPHTALLLAFLYPLGYYFAFSLSAARSRIFLILLVHLPLTIGCLAVNGNPSPAVIFCLALFVVLLFINGSVYDESSASGGLLWTMLVPAALVLLLCLALADPAHYSFDEEDVARSRRFDRLSEALSQLVHREPVDPPKETVTPRAVKRDLPMISDGHWSIRRQKLDMTNDGRYTDNDQVVLRVTADASECLYIRRCSYGDYRGDSWSLDDEEAPLSSLSFAALAAEGRYPLHTATFSLDVSSDLMLVPYFSVTDGEDDSLVRSDGSSSYTVSYRSAGKELRSEQLTGLNAEKELLYRAYAHEAYTGLPETTEYSAQKILEEAGISADDEDLIEEIASYVRQSGAYDKNTRPYQSKDHAIFFLTQSHRGYCMHFATAAAVLYRAAGVPARLTDGFMVTTKAGETVEVRLGDQHAWVEVYIDGLGWMPVEATAGSGFYEDWSAQQEEKLPSPFAPEEGLWVERPATPIPTPSPTPSPKPSENPEATRAPQETEKPAETEGADDPQLSAPALPAPDEETPPFRPSPWLLLIPAAALLFLLRELSLLVRKKRITQKDRRKAALALWREAKALCPDEASIPREIRSCAERAVFGRDAPDAKAVRSAAVAFRALEEAAARSAPLAKKLVFWLRGRICP